MICFLNFSMWNRCIRLQLQPFLNEKLWKSENSGHKNTLFWKNYHPIFENHKDSHFQHFRILSKREIHIEILKMWRFKRFLKVFIQNLKLTKQCQWSSVKNQTDSRFQDFEWEIFEISKKLIILKRENSTLEIFAFLTIKWFKFFDFKYF